MEPGWHRAYLSLGSNVDAEMQMALAFSALRGRFGEVRFSPVYRTASVGFEGADFLNAAAIVETIAPDVEPFRRRRAERRRDRAEAAGQGRALGERGELRRRAVRVGPEDPVAVVARVAHGKAFPCPPGRWWSPWPLT